MSEEKKDVNVELTDEAVEKAAGGADDPFRCPVCKYLYYLPANGPVATSCPCCGYKWI